MNEMKGKFDISSFPQSPDKAAAAIGAMVMHFEKTFTGDLSGKSIVSMLGLMNKDLGSGGYVALEKFEGTVLGKKGCFCLQHSSSMNRGVPTQKISVVPDSGTEELKSIQGDMIIDIVEGQHYYTFHYQLS